jgi:hypothetical protein
LRDLPRYNLLHCISVNETSTLENDRLQDSWKAAWQSTSFKYQCLLVLIGAIAILTAAPGFLTFIDSRQGTPLNDWIIQQLPAQDVSWYTFIILYSATLITFINLVRSPKALVVCLQAYCIVTFLRFSAIYFVPLEPPTGIIPLNDPFIAYAFYDGKPIYRDLFFSGHTALVFLLFLSVRHPLLKLILLGATFMIGFLVIKQHVHYTLDVLAAPVFTWLSYYFTRMVSPFGKSLEY